MKRRSLNHFCGTLLSLLLLCVLASAQDVTVSEKTTNIPLAPALRAEVEAALQRRDFKQAETLLVQEINQRPNTPDTAKLLTFAAGLFFLDGDFLNAAIAYKKAEKIVPLDERSRFTLAMAYIRLQRQTWAAPELERLVKEQPNNALYWYWLGRVDYDAQRYDQAVIKLNQAIALDPTMMRAYDNLGLCYDHLGNPEAAVKNLRKAIELNRTQTKPSPWPLVNLAGLLLAKNELGEAQTLLLEAIRHDPQLPQAYYHLGQVYDKQGKATEAIAVLSRAVALDATYPEPHYTLSRIYQKQGNQEKAQQALATFQQLKTRK
ncbi:MAG TPA: tetratricopeptide repeat protein [Blastocatellia bacterium]|nr:tetratricopeptide repeat protein [Blastocatellia bacterium]